MEAKQANIHLLLLVVLLFSMSVGILHNRKSKVSPKKPFNNTSLQQLAANTGLSKQPDTFEIRK